MIKIYPFNWIYCIKISLFHNSLDGHREPKSIPAIARKDKIFNLQKDLGNREMRGCNLTRL